MKNDRYILTADGTRVPHALIAPVSHLMKSLSAKWKLDVLFALGEGHVRFGEILRATPGITEHMLSVRLRDLERDGFVIRHDFNESPPRVEYSLTEATSALQPVFTALLEWARSHAPATVRRQPQGGS